MNDLTAARPLPRWRRRESVRRKLGASRAAVSCAIAALVLTAVGAIVSPDPGVVIGSGVVLAMIFLLLWQENEPPLLLIPSLFQWTAVATKPVLTIFNHVPVIALSEWDMDIRPGIYLGLVAVAAMALGMRLALGRPDRDWNAALKNESIMVTPASILRVAIGAILLGHLLFFLMRFAGQGSQLIYALANVRFAGLFALAYWCFVNRRGFEYLIAVSLVEIGIGITGFFSDFKAPIFVIMFAALAAGHRPKVRDLVVVSAIGALLIGLGSFWSAIKLDYRNYVSGGTMDQIIVVPLNDRIDYLTREVQNFDRDRFADGFDKLIRRQSYIDYLSATMNYVPESRPFEHGQRISSALIHVLTPRILFPNKPPTAFDSEVTATYTGLPLQVREGTSISIGYVGEYYIDFGAVGAAICCLVMGFCFGLAYRFLRKRGRGSVLLLYGARATVLTVMMSFETALIKYVGGVAIAFVGAYFMQRYLVPHLSRALRFRPSQPSRAVRAGAAA